MTTPKDLRAIRELMEAVANGMDNAKKHSIDFRIKSREAPEVGSAIRALLSAAEQGARAEEALRRIERWEMPPTNEKWDDGSPVSYATLFGSHGERDVIREIARAALPQSPSKVEEG